MRKLLVFPLLIFSLSLFAEDKQSSRDFNGPKERLSLKAGYYGLLAMHPGMVAGVDYSLKENTWFNFHWDTELGGYYHRWNTTAGFFQSTIGTRLTTRFSLCFDINAGIGGMVTIPNGDQYSVTDGVLQEGGRSLYGHLKPTLNFLCGWNGMRKADVPVVVLAGLEMFGQTAFNNAILPQAALRLGISYRLKP